MVANFSSYHGDAIESQYGFKFTDGTILPGVTPEESERLMVTFKEFDVSAERFRTKGDLRLSFSLSTAVYDEMLMWLNKFVWEQIDIVFCPLPMIQAMRERCLFNDMAHPFRSVRIEDRILKLVSIDKQCI